MLWFERRTVDSLIGTSDPSARAAIEEFVDGALRSMPEYLRAGVAAEALLLGALPAIDAAAGRLDRERMGVWLERWGHSRISLVRQFVRALHSLALYAEQELQPQPVPEAGAKP